MEEYLQKRINEIQNSTEIKTFGIILYNDTNANIIKLLRDNDYWKALDVASGEKFIVFSIKPKEGHMGLPEMPNGMFGMMVPIWKEPKYNNELLQLFDIESTQNLPRLFVFTQVDEYLLFQSVKINETNIDTAFKELKKIFLNINTLTETIHAKDYEHEAQVHDKIAFILKKYNAYKIVSSSDGFYGSVKKYLSPFPGNTNS